MSRSVHVRKISAGRFTKRFSPWDAPHLSALWQECLPALVTARDKLYFRGSWTGEVMQLVGPHEAVKVPRTPKGVVALVAVYEYYPGAKPRVFAARVGKAQPLDSESWRNVREFDPESWSWSAVDIPHFASAVTYPVIVENSPEGGINVFFSKLPSVHDMRIPWRRPVA